MHKCNNVIMKECINVFTVNKFLIQKKTSINMLKFIQMLKEIANRQKKTSKN